MNLQQAHELKREASDLAGKLSSMFVKQALPIAQANPFSDVPVDLEKLLRVKDKAHKRLERRTELWANIKWPNRVSRI